MNRGVAAAGGVLVLGGLVLGAMPAPLADFGCRPAFDVQGPLDQTIEVEVACAGLRADRQNAAVGLLALGLAGVAGAVLRDRRS